MEAHAKKNGVGLLEGFRNRGFWPYFAFVAISVFVLLTIVDFVLPYMFGQNQPGLNRDLLEDLGKNVAIAQFRRA